MTWLPEWSSYRFQILCFVTQSYLYGKPFYGAGVSTLSDEIDLKEMERRAYRAMERDGVTEILLGLVLLVTGGTWRTGTTGILAVFMILYMRKTLEYIKERVTYPRVGYAKLPEEGPEIGKGILLFMVAVLIVLGIGVALFYGGLTYHLIYQWLPTFFGLMMLGAFTYMRGKTGDPIYLAYIAYSVLAGVAFSLINFNDPLAGFTLYLVLLGATFILVGAVRMALFMRRYPVMKEGEEVDG